MPVYLLPMKVPSLLVTGVNKVELGEYDLPEPGEGELLLEAELTAISPGTEMRCLEGRQAGSSEYPFIPGYSFLGRVIGRGPGTRIEEGTRVFCSGTKRADKKRIWGGHVARAVTPESEVYLVPDAVDARAAVLSKLAGISFHGFRLGGARSGDSVVVIGLGPIGLLSALIHTAAGCNVLAIDKLQARLEFARNLGLRAESPDGPQAREIFPNGAAFVVDSTGIPAVAKVALGWVRKLEWGLEENPSGTLILQGSYGEEDIVLPYNEAFGAELRLVVPRAMLRSDVLSVLEWCASGKLSLAPLLSKIHRPQEAQKGYDSLINREPGIITCGFDWSSIA